MEIPINSGHYKGYSVDANPKECVNLFLCPDANNGGRDSLINRPGLVWILVWSAYPGPVRCLHAMGDYLYVVTGNMVRRTNKAFTEDTLINNGKLLLTKTGPVSIADNGTQIMISDGQWAYLYDSSDSSFQRLNEEEHGFLGGGSVTMKDNYFISNETDGAGFYISTLGNGLSWDATDLTIVQTELSDLVKVVSAGNVLWCFKERSTEAYYNSGNASQPFQRLNGGFSDKGIAAKDSAATVMNNVVWLDSEKVIRVTQGLSSKIISSPQLGYIISQYNTVSDAIAFSYTDCGMVFYQITFPTENETWLYEFSKNNWTKLESFQAGSGYGRHRANCHCHFGGANIIGDYKTSVLGRLDLNTYTDFNNTIIRSWATPLLIGSEWNSFQLFCECGVGLNVNPPTDGVAPTAGYDPEASLSYSNDGGHTWSNSISRSIGKVGEYDTKVIWRRLGHSSTGKRVFRTEFSSPTKTAIYGARVNED